MTRSDFTGIVYPCVEYDFEDRTGNIRDQTDYMLARTMRIFEYSGLPDTIPQRSLEMLLQCNGYAGIVSVRGQLYAMRGGLGGEPDANYMPTILTVANPALNYSDNLKIGTETVIIRNDSVFKGILPMVQKYATQISENDLTMRLVDIMARVNTALTAGTDRDMESAKEFLRQLIAGKLTPIASSEFLEGIKGIPMTSSGNKVSMTDLIEYEQYLRAGIFNELGINASYNMKREALNSNETTVNVSLLYTLIDDMLQCRREDLEKVNDMFGTNITVKLSGVWADLDEQREEVSDDEEATDISGSDAGVDDGRNNDSDGESAE